MFINDDEHIHYRKVIILKSNLLEYYSETSIGMLYDACIYCSIKKILYFN